MAGLLERIAARFGMSTFTIYDLPSPEDTQLKPNVRLTNARRFHDDYDRHQLLGTSPLFARLRKSTTPETWCLEDMREGRSEAQYLKLREIAAEAGIRSSAMIPVHKIDGTRGVVSFAGDRDKVNAHELSILGLIAVHAYDIFDRLPNRTDSLPIRLTSREVEVLEWVANGKTSGEIASILSLSDHTINTYMNAAMRKLDCVNRTQLVAKALRLGLIQ